MCHLRVISDSLEVVAVYVYEWRYSLTIECLANNIKERSARHSKKLCFVRTQSPASGLLMSQENKIRKYRHSNSGIVAVDNGVCIKLSGAARAKKLQLVPMRKYYALHFITPDSAYHCFKVGPDSHSVRVIWIPYIKILRCVHYWQTCKVTLNTDSLYFLNTAFEIPWSVSISEY